MGILVSLAPRGVLYPSNLDRWLGDALLEFVRNYVLSDCPIEVSLAKWFRCPSSYLPFKGVLSLFFQRSL